MNKLGAILLLAFLAGCNGSHPAATENVLPQQIPMAAPKFAHVILMIQENRSFDNFFATYPGADGTTTGKMIVPGTSTVQTVTLKESSIIGRDIGHTWQQFVQSYDGGKMDGFSLNGWGGWGGGPPIGAYPYQYVEPSQIQPYWNIAQQWVLADEMFQTQGSGSFTAHQDLIRGGTCIEACPPPSSPPSANTESLIDNPSNFPWGCDSVGKYTYTWQINIYGSLTKGPFPCSNDFPNYGSSPDYETLANLLAFPSAHRLTCANIGLD